MSAQGHSTGVERHEEGWRGVCVLCTWAGPVRRAESRAQEDGKEHEERSWPLRSSEDDAPADDALCQCGHTAHWHAAMAFDAGERQQIARGAGICEEVSEDGSLCGCEAFRAAREVEKLPGDGQRPDIDLLAEIVGKLTLWVQPHTESRSCVQVEGEYYWGETPSAAISFAILATRMGVRDTEREHEPAEDEPEIWVEPRGFPASKESFTVLTKPVAFVPETAFADQKAALERLRDRLTACEPRGECPVCGGARDHVDTCEVGVFHQHAEVLAKALDQFFGFPEAELPLSLNKAEAKLYAQVEPTLRALGYSK